MNKRASLLGQFYTVFFNFPLGPGIPKVTVHSTRDPSSYVILEDNNPMSEALEDKRLPESLFRTVQADNHGREDQHVPSFTFSERYLGLPAKEEHAYLHSAELLSRLVKVEANYSLQLYPDEGHILREPRSVKHFQRTVVNYLQNCLKHSTLLDAPEEEAEEDD
ncbi:hypothetical protein GOODEAATRI_006521 [Goodea atripinnis]|uniref:Peptidase S9 prolyl oligopeptidase catalytic domain-containing protein n=1 Tax=Goodea atripinnis TaxID=208336 RepID=A0ABV0PLJ2_9TELE